MFGKNKIWKYQIRPTKVNFKNILKKHKRTKLAPLSRVSAQAIQGYGGNLLRCNHWCPKAYFHTPLHQGEQANNKLL